MGPKCELSGEKCDVLTSSCPAKHGQCFASGPGRDHFESTKIIATRLFKGAWVHYTSLHFLPHRSLMSIFFLENS